MFLITKYPQMKYTVITTFHPAGWELYGQKMIDAFERFWPQDVDLWVYAERCNPTKQRSNTHVIDLESASPRMMAFKGRHRDNPRARGDAGPDGTYDNKKQFRWDAIRFCHKVYAIDHALKHAQGDWLIWLDADSHTHTPVTHALLEQVCPANVFASYLGRGEKYHSECGWIAYNLHHPQLSLFNQRLLSLYDTDELFNLAEWHDSFLWDHVRREFQDRELIKMHNLNPADPSQGKAGHPFINSVLGTVMDHMKGDRKHRGHSKAKELRSHHDHPYWQKILANPKS